MSKVIMMCGVCGSGKTTYAKKKEQEGYIRLSIDEEMWKLYGRKGIDYPEEQYEKLSEQVEAALQKKLLSLIQQGKDVVIDFSFWSKENRNFYKELIQKAGAETELVYMKASKELLQKRLYKRNQVLNANSPFVITDEILEHHYHAFQEPCGEGEKVILQKEDIIQYSKEESKAIWNQNHAKRMNGFSYPMITFSFFKWIELPPNTELGADLLQTVSFSLISPASISPSFSRDSNSIS